MAKAWAAWLSPSDILPKTVALVAGQRSATWSCRVTREDGSRFDLFLKMRRDKDGWHMTEHGARFGFTFKPKKGS